MNEKISHIFEFFSYFFILLQFLRKFLTRGMLCQFSVLNFESIKDRVTLNLQAGSITEHLDSVITEQDGEKLPPLLNVYAF